MVQALAYSGALSEFGDRNQIAENYEAVSKFAKYSQEVESNGQTDIFGAMDDGDSNKDCKLEFKDFSKSTNMQCLKWEKEFLGMYVTSHPLRGLRKYISRKGHLIGTLTKKQLDKPVRIVGLVTGLRKIMTKAGGFMATFTIEDPSGKISAIMFPKNFANFGNEIVEDQVVGVNGRLDNKRGQCQVACDMRRYFLLIR
jgi:DNA polymerase-3 subunit alpha